MTYEYVSQAAIDLGLKWYPGDPVNLSWYVDGVDWSGTYTAKLRQYEDPTSAEVATFTVSATYSAGTQQTTFVVTLATSVAQGEYWWSCKQTGGVTRFSGPVFVHA